MMNKRPLTLIAVLIFAVGLPAAWAQARPQAQLPTAEQQILEAMHGIDSQKLFGYVQELVSEKYGGRLTGTAEYNLCAEWVASLMKKWGIEPAGAKGAYFPSFPNP